MDNKQPSPLKLLSGKRTITICVGVFAACIVFAVIILTSGTKKEPELAQNSSSEIDQDETNGSPDGSGSQTMPQIAREKVFLDFSEHYIDASDSDERVTVDVILNTQQTKSSGTNLAIVYNTDSIADLEIIPAFDGGSLYGENSDVTNLSHSPQEGTYVLGISTIEEGSSVEGKGKIATLSFRPLKSSSTKTTTITFSSVSESILGSSIYRAELGSLEVKVK